MRICLESSTLNFTTSPTLISGEVLGEVLKPTIKMYRDYESTLRYCGETLTYHFLTLGEVGEVLGEVGEVDHHIKTAIYSVSKNASYGGSSHIDRLLNPFDLMMPSFADARSIVLYGMPDSSSRLDMSRAPFFNASFKYASAS